MNKKFVKKANTLAVLKRLFKYIKGYKWLFVISTVLAAVSSILSLYLPVLIGKAVDNIIGPANVNFKALMPVIYKALIVIAISSMASWLMNAINNRITFAVVKDIRKAAFDKLQKLPVAYIDKHPAGEILNKIITGVDQLSDGLLMGFSQFFTGLVTIFGTLFFMLSINITIAVLVVCITPLSLLVASFIAKKTHFLFEKRNTILGKETAYINEILENEKLIKAFAYETESIKEFKKLNDNMSAVSLKAVFFSSVTNPSTRFVNGIVYAAVTFSGAVLVIKGKLSVGQLTSFLSYANQYTKPFNEISGVITELQNAVSYAEMVFELIEEEEEQDKCSDCHILLTAKGDISFENVSFSYNKEREFIKNLNLRALSGKRIALVGPTGCGKTTLINLLMRFYDADSGTILIDNNDAADYTRKSLRKMFGMLLQDSYLKTGTIRENIAIGKPDATDEEIIMAAKKAHAHSFIKRLEKAYDTEIGENNQILSAGQKQLICIARVMLSLPPMLILDEATSSIDTRTEIKIQKAFSNLMEGRTSFIVAHRLSTIKEADCILVMKDGKIIESGKHEELMKTASFYKELYESSII